MDSPKFYILDDTFSSARQISHIIESRGLGEIAALQNRTENAAAEILARNPDIAVLDLTLPSSDGISIIRQVSDINPLIRFIMFSRPEEKNAVSHRYRGLKALLEKWQEHEKQ